MQDTRNTGTPEYALTNERMIPWIRRNVETSKWIIELTGGEPSLYEGIDELTRWLSVNGYRTIIKTNGMLPIAPIDNVIRVGAFHIVGNPPKYFDKILIVDKIDREKKERICIDNGWDYKVIGYNNDPLPGESHGFCHIAYLDPHGHPLPCKRTRVMYEEWPDRYAMEYTGIRQTRCCPHCKAAIDCWKFLPEQWKI